MEPPSPTQALGVNPFPSRYINRTASSLRRFRALTEGRATENREMTVVTVVLSDVNYSCDSSASHNKIRMFLHNKCKRPETNFF